MRATPLPPAVYAKHRQRLTERLLPGALAVVLSQDQILRGGNGLLPFVQDPDMLYLCGIEQPEAILLLFADAANSRDKEVLFVKAPLAHTALWQGDMPTKQEISTRTGIAQVHYLEEFALVLHRIMAQAEHVYIPTQEHPGVVPGYVTPALRFAHWCKERYPMHSYQRLTPHLAWVRMFKSQEEIGQIRRSCSITAQAFLHVLPVLRPEITEYAIQAELIYTLTRLGAEGFAYAPIIASGKNGCILHYTDNNKPCGAGDMVLMDFGAEYGHYHADLTRTVPVIGRFSPRQRDVYNAVYRVLEQAKGLLRVGETLARVHDQIGSIITEELLDLGLLTSSQVRSCQGSAYKRYFMHGLSHHLGLETHDASHKDAQLAEGMVLTLEPGIYIPEEGIAVRLEDDVVLTPQGLEVLTKEAPLETSDIEARMRG